MRSWEYKIFRDNVHGYIRIPIPFLKIIDSDVFQRLRYIEQTGMRILYPSARHDRFIHSLGTYHIGQKAIIAFRENVKLYYSNHCDERRNHYKIIDNEFENNQFWDKSEVLFSIACLLHDCGHAPFSHTFEHIYDMQKCNDGRNKSLLDEQLLKAFPGASFIKDFGSGIGKEHERMSALIVELVFHDTITEIVKDEFGECTNNDIEFILRSIIGCKYSEISNKENQIKNCMIDLLNSESIDVDGLDYIIRDAVLSGVDNVSIDIDRLLNSLTIIEKTHFQNCSLTDFKLNNVLLNSELNGKLNGNVSGVIFADNFKGSIKGQVCIKGKGKVIDPVQFNDGFALVGSTRCKSTIPDTEDITSFDFDTILADYLNVEQANYKSLDRLNVNINTDQTSNFRMGSVFYSGIINGSFSGEVLGCFYEKDTKIEIVLAFHKSSLSVLQNVIYARNYEYQWIYGHHKVVYYSNFLLVHILRQTAKYIINEDSNISTDDFLIKMLSMVNLESYQEYKFFRNNDSDFHYLFRLCSINNSVSDTPDIILDYLYKELFTRKYKKSVWKSYAEFNVFFSELSDKEKSNLYKVIKDNSENIGTNKLYGFFKQEWNELFRSIDMKDVVWVSSEVKIKDLDPDKTFILMKDNSMRLKDVSIDSAFANKRKIDYFYLYYSSEHKLSKDNLDKLISFLKEMATT